MPRQWSFRSGSSSRPVQRSRDSSQAGPQGPQPHVHSQGSLGFLALRQLNRVNIYGCKLLWLGVTSYTEKRSRTYLLNSFCQVHAGTQ